MCFKLKLKIIEEKLSKLKRTLKEYKKLRRRRSLRFSQSKILFTLNVEVGRSHLLALRSLLLLRRVEGELLLLELLVLPPPLRHSFLLSVRDYIQ